MAIVGKGQPFKIFNDEENQHYLNMAKERGAAPVPHTPGDDDDDAPSTAEEEMPPPIASDDGAVPEAMDE